MPITLYISCVCVIPVTYGVIFSFYPGYLRSNSKQTKLDYYVDDTDTGSDHYLTFHCDLS